MRIKKPFAGSICTHFNLLLPPVCEGKGYIQGAGSEVGALLGAVGVRRSVPFKEQGRSLNPVLLASGHFMGALWERWLIIPREYLREGEPPTIALCVIQSFTFPNNRI